MFPQCLRRRSTPNIADHSCLAIFSCGKMTHESRMLIAIEVALWLRVTPGTVYAWAAAGKIPCVRLGGAVRFVHSDIERWIHKRTSLPTDSPSLSHSIISPISPQQATVSRQMIQQAGVRAIRQVTGRQQTQRNSQNQLPLPTEHIETRKDRA